MQTLMGKILEHGSDWSTSIADKFFGGNRKECNRWMKAVLVTDGMFTVTQSEGQGNWYNITTKGKFIKSL